MFASWRAFTILFIFFALLLFGVWPLLQTIYPLAYSDLIYEHSTEAGLDPFLVAAIIQAESSFRPDVVSSKGALGLMQVMPETAYWIAEREEISLGEVSLTDPSLNIKLGTLYIAYLFTQFPTEVASLAAYNGGQGNVSRWLDEGVWDGSFQMTRNIPYRETRNYVRRVVLMRQFYRLIHHNKWVI